MDLGLEVRQLADLLGVSENSITGWELRGIYPSSDYLRKVVEFIDAHHSEPIPRKTMWSLCFAQNPSYPVEPKSLGDQIRAARMENFMSIGQLAETLGINKSTIAKWELKGRQPCPDLLFRVQAFLESHDCD